MSTDNSGHRPKKVRSPAYPAFDLRTAIERAGVVYRAERKSSAPVSVVAGHFGMVIKSSSALRLISALKQFGLLIEEGNNEDRTVRLSPLALDIILAESENSPERKEAIRKAALHPKIHKAIWTRYEGELPSDATLRSHLLKDLDFNDSFADKFIRQFRSTIAFSGLQGGDTMGSGAEEDQEPDDGEEEMNGVMEEQKGRTARSGGDGGGAQQKQAGGGTSRGGDEWAGPSVRFDLPRGNMVEIRLRSKLTPKDFEKLKKIFALSELAFVEDDPGTDPDDDQQSE